MLLQKADKAGAYRCASCMRLTAFWMLLSGACARFLSPLPVMPLSSLAGNCRPGAACRSLPVKIMPLTGHELMAISAFQTAHTNPTCLNISPISHQCQLGGTSSCSSHSNGKARGT